MGKLFTDLRQAESKKNLQIEAFRAEVASLREEKKQLEKQLALLRTPLPIVEPSNPRIDMQTPSPAYLEDKMPTYKVKHLIEHLEFRAHIHETYIGLVDDDPTTWGCFGSVEFHEWAIEGYLNAQYYLARLL